MSGRPVRSSRARPARPASASATDRAEQDGDVADPQRRSPAADRSSSPNPAPIHLSDLYRGHGRLGLIRDLAFGEFSPAEIASTLGDGITGHDVTSFAEAHADEIREVRAALAGQLAIETAGTWISKKQNRLAELQADVEDLNSVIALLRDTGRLGGKTHHDSVKVKISALRAAADEMSPRGMSLTRRQDEDDKNVVHYVIEAEDGTDITGALT